jgi:iron(III) transport system ATP-binding protein
MTDTSPSAIHCHQLEKRFGALLALDGFELEVLKGSILSLLGPSGCGKTTALRVIAGFTDPDSGTITIADREVFGTEGSTPPERRRVGMVFQDYALFPHMTVAGNIAYGLGAGEVARADAALELVGLAGLGNRMPHELSGGEQQRIALARALAPQPDVILLDEPFSNLDATLRGRMRRDVRQILRDAEITAVLVTHDQEEALAIADVVAVMRAGKVLQTASPTELYRHPVSPWVAGFVGDAQFVDGEADLGKITIPLGVFPHQGPERGPVKVLIRPEWVHATRHHDGAVTVVDREFYGHDQLLMLEMADGRQINARVGTYPFLDIGDRVEIALDEIVVFDQDASVGPAS